MTDLGHLEQAEVISWSLLLALKIHAMIVQSFHALCQADRERKRVCFDRRTSNSMEKAEEMIGMTQILVYYGQKKTFILDTEASDFAIGIVLSQ